MSMHLSSDRFDAVLFDLDGVLTDTAAVHARAWKQTFDGYLRGRLGSAYGEFTAEDYDRYVDGKPRYDGVRDFLAARGIQLPEGDPSDPPDAETVCGIGNRKDRALLALLREEPPRPLDDGAALLAAVRAAGMRTAVVSSSKNCHQVLEAVGMADDFDAEVDGIVAEQLHLPGKPHPDTFLEAARRLGTPPARAVVVEDALAGAAAGAAGGFGLVVGVDRGAGIEKLRAHGADVVVTDLREVAPVRDWPG